MDIEQSDLQSTQNSKMLIMQQLSLEEQLWGQLALIPLARIPSIINQLREKYEHISYKAFMVIVEYRLGENFQGLSSILQSTQLRSTTLLSQHSSLSSLPRRTSQAVAANQPTPPISMVGPTASIPSQFSVLQAPSPTSSSNRPPKLRISYPSNQANSETISQKQVIVLHQNKNKEPKKYTSMFASNPTSSYLTNRWIGIDDYRKSFYFQASIENQRRVDKEFYDQHLKRFDEEDTEYFSVQQYGPPPFIDYLHSFSQDHCNFCFEVLINYVKTEYKTPTYRANLKDFRIPFYVCWLYGDEIRGKETGHLRYVWVSQTLGQTALYAASPSTAIELEEIFNLSVRITWFTKAFEGRGIFDWKLGEHGILLDCWLDGVAYRSCLLPQVIKEKKWTKKQALQELLRAAKFEGDLINVVKRIQLTVFECHSIVLHYRDYYRSLEELRQN